MSVLREYRPALLSRQGEGFAWLVALGLMVGLLLAGHRGGALPGSYWIGAGLSVLVAGAISFSNWVDRHSVIRLDEEGILFENGLRSVWLTWPEVRRVAVCPTRLGMRVQVRGEDVSFVFRTVAEVPLGDRTVRSGFVEWETILQTILEKGKLEQRTERDGVVYYGRGDQMVSRRGDYEH